MALIDTIKNYLKRGKKPSQAQFWEWLGYIYFRDQSIPVGSLTFGEQVLTCASTTVYDFAVNSNSMLTIDQDTTLSIANMAVGNFGIIVVQQDGTGGWELTFPTGSLVCYDEVISATADAVSIVSIYCSVAGYLITVNPVFVEQ